MKVTINHDACQHSSQYADRCVGATIRDPLGHERYCAAEVVDDGKPELTVVLLWEGKTYTLVLNEANRDFAASLGWDAFVHAQQYGFAEG